MKETKTERNTDPVRNPETGKLEFGEPVYRTTMGNFIKFMILNDGVDDAILNYFGTNFSLLYKLLREVNWNNCKLHPVGNLQVDICKELGIQKSIYNDHLAMYVKLGLLKRIGRGEYMVNPNKIFVGDAEAQRKAMIEHYDRRNYGG